MDKQMELFEEGGLKDEGGMVDEVSGNDVPVGSTREEVRDDIPAQLSEGEFVFPADVTRYIGLDKLMQLRQQAKRGLKKMEAMGQMGNSDEATLPDDLPFGMEDLIIVEAVGPEEPQEFNQGGMPVDPNTGVYYTGSTGVTMLPPTQQQPVAQVPQQPTAPAVPMQPTGGATGGYQPLFMQGQAPTTAPSFTTLMSGSELTYKTYVNAAGDNILVPFIGDNPLYPIPEGYTLSTGVDEQTGRPTGGGAGGGGAGTATDAGTGVAQVIESGGGDDGPPPVEPSAFQKAGGWTMDTSGKDGAALDMWIKEAQKVTGHGNVVTGILGLINPLMGAAAWAANKHQKQQILKMLDEKIAQAKLTPIEGQVAALRKIKDELENGSNKGILGKAIDLVSDALGLSEEEKEVAKKNTAAAVEETKVTDTDDVEATTEDKTTDKITTIDGTTAESVIKDAGYSSVEAYAAEVERRMLEGKETQQDVVKQTVVDMTGAPGFRERDDITAVEPVTAPFLEEAPIVSADETARANLAATAFKDRGINKDNITAAEFEMIKNSEEAKAALGIDPSINTYAQVKQAAMDVVPEVSVGRPAVEETPEAAVETTLGETSVIDNLMDTRGLVGKTRLGDKVPFNLMGFGSEETAVDTKDDPLYTFFTSDRSAEMIDRIASGEPVTVAEISQYLETVGAQAAPSTTKELLDTGTRVSPVVGASMDERDRFYREKAAREEAERLAREEAARRAAEEAARKKAEEEAEAARVREAMEAAARARAAEEARLQAQRDAAQRAAAQQQQQQAEQVVMSQPVKSSNNDDNYSAPIFKSNQTSSQKAASNVGFGSPTGGWTPSGFNFGQSSSRRGGGGGGRAKGGLLEKPKAKTKKATTKNRGLAARKK